MLHALRLGIDSHGVRLALHYARVLRGGRVNRTPKMQIRRTALGSAVLDADNGLGHAAGTRQWSWPAAWRKKPGLMQSGWSTRPILARPVPMRLLEPRLASSQSGCRTRTRSLAFTAELSGSMAQTPSL